MTKSGNDLHRVRFRFRCTSPLAVRDSSIELSLGDQIVTLAARKGSNPISESKWLVMNACGIASEYEAKNYASRLKTATQLAAVAARWGIDAGRDRVTTSFANDLNIPDDIHGIDVFPDTPDHPGFVVVEGAISVSTPAHWLTAPLRELMDGEQDLNLSEESRRIIYLLNLALMQQHPVATIVFSVSAVEALAQKPVGWSVDQQRLIQEVRAFVNSSSIGTASEQDEICTAIKNQLSNRSLGNSVRTLLDSLGLGHFKPDWKELYNERSALVHGRSTRSQEEIPALATRAISMCGRILITALEKEVPGIRRLSEARWGNW